MKLTSRKRKRSGWLRLNNSLHVIMKRALGARAWSSCSGAHVLKPRLVSQRALGHLPCVTRPHGAAGGPVGFLSLLSSGRHVRQDSVKEHARGKNPQGGT